MECRKVTKSFLTIDWKTLPIKLHFLLYALALSALMSYFPIMAKSIGISATAVGIIYTISPFLTVLTNPVFGWITDKLQKVTLVLIGMIIIQTPLFIGTAFVPPLKTESPPFSAGLICSLNNSSSMVFLNVSTVLIPNNTNVQCRSKCLDCGLVANSSLDDWRLCGDDVRLTAGKVFNTSELFKVTNISFHGRQVFPRCDGNKHISLCKTSCRYDVESEVEEMSEFASYQFWTLLILMVSSIVMTNAVIAIGDAACYEALKGRVNQFGKQRVGISIGWGVGTMITGYILDLTKSSEDDEVNFAYGAYVMLILIVFDIIALSQAKLKKPKPSENIFKDVCKIFARLHTAFFAVAALLIGLFSGLQWNYYFWYLEELGASKFLLGISMAVLCVLVEAPFMFISGFVVKRIGRDNTLVLALLSFACWFLCMSFIKNPLWSLLINLSQGPSYGLFYAAMTSYGKIATVPGTEATMQTVLGAIFHGLGIGSGSLLGGLGFDLYGGKLTYRFSGVVAVSIAIIYKLLTYYVAGENTVMQQGNVDTQESHKQKIVLPFHQSIADEEKPEKLNRQEDETGKEGTSIKHSLT